MNDELLMLLEQYMFVNSELVLINDPKVITAHLKVTEAVNKNGAYIWSSMLPRNTDAALFDKDRPRVLLQDLADAMREHLDSLRPVADV